MKKKLKVLMVVFNLHVVNGVTSYVMNYFRAMDHSAIIIDFVVCQNVDTPYYEEIRKEGGEIYILPPVIPVKNYIAVCKKIINDGNYDIVHDNILILSIFIMYYAKKEKVPVRILHSHSSRLSGSKYKELRNRLLLPFFLHTATDYVACSKSAAKAMFGKAACTIVPNVISSQQMSFNSHIRNDMRRKMGVENKIVIGSVGRLAIEKNPFYAIDVIIEASQNISNIQYWWIGSGPLAKKVNKYIEDRNATQYICLLGDRTDVADLYQAMDMFFLPSFFEGLPITGLEAQAMGLPCLVSDTVSDEFVYTDLVKFFSMKNSVAKTVNLLKAILCELTDNRSSYTLNLEKSKFNARQSGKFLLNIYEGLYRKHELLSARCR